MAFYGATLGKSYRITKVTESGYWFVNDNGSTRRCSVDRVKKAAKPKTDSKETIFKVGDYFEVVDETSYNVCSFGVKRGDIRQVTGVDSEGVYFKGSDDDNLYIFTSAIKKAPKPTEDNKLSETIDNLKAENKKQAEMLNLAWSDLEEYDNAFSSKSRLIETQREAFLGFSESQIKGLLSLIHISEPTRPY